MSITDELKDFANSGMSAMECAAYSDKLIAIADRIDAEHEEALSQAYMDVSDSEWVRLPKDADNVPWNVGDCDEDGNEVTELRLTSSGWCVLTDDEWPYRPERHRHYHAPTVEDVLQEFTSAIFEWSRKSGTVAEVGTWSDVAAKYAAQLQLKEY